MMMSATDGGRRRRQGQRNPYAVPQGQSDRIGDWQRARDGFPSYYYKPSARVAFLGMTFSHEWRPPRTTREGVRDDLFPHGAFSDGFFRQNMGLARAGRSTINFWTRLFRVCCSFIRVVFDWILRRVGMDFEWILRRVGMDFEWYLEGYV